LKEQQLERIARGKDREVRPGDEDKEIHQQIQESDVYIP